MQMLLSLETHQHPPGLQIWYMIPLPPRSHHRIRSNKLVEVAELGFVYLVDAKRVSMRMGLLVR